MTESEIKAKIDKMEHDLENLKFQLKQAQETPWRAKKGDGYFFINSYLDVDEEREDFSDYDTNFYLAGNYFKDYQTAEDMSYRIKYMLRIQQLHDMICPEFNNCDKKRGTFFVRYCGDDKFHSIYSTSQEAFEDTSLFPDFETAAKVANILNKEFHKV